MIIPQRRQWIRSSGLDRKKGSDYTDLMSGLIHSLQSLLLNPARVGLICLLAGFLAITYDGSLYRYWSLKQTEKDLQERIAQVKTATAQVRSQIEQSKSHAFIEREAREKLDLVGPDEIVFLFAEEEVLTESDANLR